MGPFVVCALLLVVFQSLLSLCRLGLGSALTGLTRTAPSKTLQSKLRIAVRPVEDGCRCALVSLAMDHLSLNFVSDVRTCREQSYLLRAGQELLPLRPLSQFLESGNVGLGLGI